MERGADSDDTMAHSTGAYSLLLSGIQKKFRGSRGNKEGGKRGWYLLQKSGLGDVKEFKACSGTDMVIRSTTLL